MSESDYRETLSQLLTDTFKAHSTCEARTAHSFLNDTIYPAMRMKKLRDLLGQETLRDALRMGLVESKYSGKPSLGIPLSNLAILKISPLPQRDETRKHLFLLKALLFASVVLVLGLIVFLRT